MDLVVTAAPHPRLELAAFATDLPGPIGSLSAGPLADGLRTDATAPLQPTDAVRAAVRDLLRVGGLPISVVDLGRATAPFRVALAPAEATYVFNASGQALDLAGLLCLWDAHGPCANAVKDAQRTKTHEGTVRTLSIVWGTIDLPGRAEATVAWYRELIGRLGASTSEVAIVRA